MLRVHLIKFLLKLEPQLYFFLMVLSVLRVLLLELQPHLPLVHPLLLKRLAIFLQHLHILLDDLLVVRLLFEPGLVLLLHLVHFFLVLQRDLLDEHAVVGAAAVLKKDRKYLPERRYYCVFFVGVVQAFV